MASPKRSIQNIPFKTRRVIISSKKGFIKPL